LAWEEGQFPLDFLQGDIVLLPKKGDNTLLFDKRPITLLNCKYNIYNATIWHIRLTPIAQDTISRNQTAFLPTRSIHHFVFLCSEVLHYCISNKPPVVFVKIDFSKAYDKVQWSFMYQMFAAMGYSQHFLAFLSTFTIGSNSHVLVNGTRGDNFEITQSVRQGWPLSTLLIIIFIHALSKCICTEQASDNIKGIQLPGTNIKYLKTSYADDTHSFLMHTQQTCLQRRIYFADSQVQQGLLSTGGSLMLGGYPPRIGQSPPNFYTGYGSILMT
jgi:hypothetical protein